jgi:hypothetical protein
MLKYLNLHDREQFYCQSKKHITFKTTPYILQFQELPQQKICLALFFIKKKLYLEAHFPFV